MHPAREEFNKHNLIFDWPIIMIHPGGLLLVVVPPPVCSPHLSFMGEVAKEYITKLGCQKYFLHGHIVRALEWIL